MINSFIRYFFCAFVIVSMASCNHNEAYYKFIPIPQNEWSKQNDICFNLDSLLGTPKHNYTISVEITHNIDYPYKNLFLYLNHTLQDSVSSRDTLECILVNDYGKWYGSGNGATRQLSVLYKTNYKIDTALHNEFCIRHAMQDLKLKGIERIGLKVY